MSIFKANENAIGLPKLSARGTIPATYVGCFGNGDHIVPRKSHNFTRALAKWAGCWRTPGLAGLLSISFSNRLRKSAGRVRPKAGIVTLHAKLITAPRSVVLEVLCHEAAHVAAYLLHGSRVKPHGSQWRALVQAAGYQPSTSLRSRWLPPPAPAPSSSRRHHYRCPVCQADYFVRRRNSHLHCTPCLRVRATAPLHLVAPT